MGLSVGDCIAVFERVAKKAFELHYPLPFLAVFLSFFTDGIYPTQNLDTALKEIFGEHQTILDCSSAAAMGTKVGIVASTMKPAPFLFTNYNGSGEREDQRLQQHATLLGDALLWEMYVNLTGSITLTSVS